MGRLRGSTVFRLSESPASDGVKHPNSIFYTRSRYRHRRLVERKFEQEEAAHKAKELTERQKRESEVKRGQERRQRLFVQARNWKQAADVREFMEAVLKHEEARLHSEVLAAWASGALSEADALDPLCAPLPNLLGEADVGTPNPCET